MLKSPWNQTLKRTPTEWGDSRKLVGMGGFFPYSDSVLTRQHTHTCSPVILFGSVLLVFDWKVTWMGWEEYSVKTNWGIRGFVATAQDKSQTNCGSAEDLPTSLVCWPSSWGSCLKTVSELLLTLLQTYLATAKNTSRYMEKFCISRVFSIAML